jgi:hypothetical protein
MGPADNVMETTNAALYAPPRLHQHSARALQQIRVFL